MSGKPAWKSYEDVAAYLLTQVRDRLGLSRVEEGQVLAGASGTTWTLDAKGTRESDGLTVIIECRRHTVSRIDQESIAAIAFRIKDTGSAGGILVSPLGLQEGAVTVARATGIVEVTLNADATPNVFTMLFLDQLRMGPLGKELTVESGNPKVVYAPPYYSLFV